MWDKIKKFLYNKSDDKIDKKKDNNYKFIATVISRWS